MIMNKLLVESKRRGGIIRTIVRDIIKLYKMSDDSVEYYLPEEINGETTYYFPGFDYDISVELEFVVTEDVKSYLVNSVYWHEDDVISVKVIYNSDVKDKITYDLIGELNEVVAHEIRHVDQKHRGLFDINNKEEVDSYKYYTQPEEIDAQYFGFKRLSKITKKPFDFIVKNWFDTHKDIHQLNDRETSSVIDKILTFKPIQNRPQ
jgi:hypothetical protein